MQAFRTGKIGRAGRGDKVHTCRGQVGKKTVWQAGPKVQTNIEQTKQDRHDRNEDKQTEEKDSQTGNQHRACRHSKQHAKKMTIKAGR
jgi:hypothetical protein